MARWGMVIDLDRCTVCQACVVACRQENNIPFSDPRRAGLGRAISWMEILPIIEAEEPELRVKYLPRPCMHCDNPACTKVCPVGATYKSEEGIVAQIYPRCIGCRYCSSNCPYTARYFNWLKPHWPKEMENYLNPEVSIRDKGIVEKCTFCHHRLILAKERVEAEGRQLEEGDYVPACVEICPTGAIYFGDLDDPNSRVSELSRSERAFRLLEDLGTEPKVFYLSKP